MLHFTFPLVYVPAPNGNGTTMVPFFAGQNNGRLAKCKRTHGHDFWEWVAQVTEQFPSKNLQITEQHGYILEGAKYVWQCSHQSDGTPGCGKSWHQFSNSFWRDNPDRKCNICGGEVVRIRPERLPPKNAKSAKRAAADEETNEEEADSQDLDNLSGFEAFYEFRRLMTVKRAPPDKESNEEEADSKGSDNVSGIHAYHEFRRLMNVERAQELQDAGRHGTTRRALISKWWAEHKKAAEDLQQAEEVLESIEDPEDTRQPPDKEIKLEEVTGEEIFADLVSRMMDQSDPSTDDGGEDDDK